MDIFGNSHAVEHLIEVEFHGGFSLLIGPNGAGKTTTFDGLYLAHPERIPYLRRPTAEWAVMRGAGGHLPRDRGHRREPDESRLANRLQAEVGLVLGGLVGEAD